MLLLVSPYVGIKIFKEKKKKRKVLFAEQGLACMHDIDTLWHIQKTIILLF